MTANGGQHGFAGRIRLIHIQHTSGSAQHAAESNLGQCEPLGQGCAGELPSAFDERSE